MDTIEINELLTSEQRQKIHKLLIDLSPEQQRDTINKAIRLIKQDINEVKKDDKDRYLPDFKKFEIVHCNFTGIGYEWDFPHYAMIWDVDPILDSVEVIPMTSKNREKHPDVFSIGKVFGLPDKESTLLISDRTRVSRKRIKKIIVKHPKHGRKAATVPKSWEKKIINGILSKNMLCVPFQYIISEKCGVAMVDTIKKYNQLKFKAVKDYCYDRENRILTYRLWDSTTVQKENLILPELKTSKDYKKVKLKQLNSTETEIIKLSKSYFEEYYNITT